MARFDAYGWHTQHVADGNDLDAIEAAISAARADDRPSIIAVRTHIGFGSPNRQAPRRHTARRSGPEEVRLTKEAYGWDPDKTFFIPDAALAHFRAAVPAGEAARRRLGRAVRRLRRRATPQLAAELRRRISG